MPLGLTDGAAVYLGPQSELELNSVADPRAARPPPCSTCCAASAGRWRPSGLFRRAGRQRPAAESLAPLATSWAQIDPWPAAAGPGLPGGACRLTTTSANLALAAGQHSWLDAFGGPFAPDADRPDVWTFAGLDRQRLRPRPARHWPATLAPSATGVTAATATASNTAQPSTTASSTPTVTASPKPSRHGFTHSAAGPAGRACHRQRRLSTPTEVPPTQVPPTQAPPQPTSPPQNPPTSTPVPANPPTSTPVPPYIDRGMLSMERQRNAQSVFNCRHVRGVLNHGARTLLVLQFPPGRRCLVLQRLWAPLPP